MQHVFTHKDTQQTDPTPQVSSINSSVISVKGFLSNPVSKDHGKREPNRKKNSFLTISNNSSLHYFFVNGRPTLLPKGTFILHFVYELLVVRIISHVYYDMFKKRNPHIFLHFELPYGMEHAIQLILDMFDMNVSPDKRKIFFCREDEILVALRVCLYLKFNDTVQFGKFL